MKQFVAAAWPSSGSVAALALLPPGHRGTQARPTGAKDGTYISYGAPPLDRKALQGGVYCRGGSKKLNTICQVLRPQAVKATLPFPVRAGKARPSGRADRLARLGASVRLLRTVTRHE